MLIENFLDITYDIFVYQDQIGFNRVLSNVDFAVAQKNLVETITERKLYAAPLGYFKHSISKEAAIRLANNYCKKMTQDANFIATETKPIKLKFVRANFVTPLWYRCDYVSDTDVLASITIDSRDGHVWSHYEVNRYRSLWEAGYALEVYSTDLFEGPEYLKRKAIIELSQLENDKPMVRQMLDFIAKESENGEFRRFVDLWRSRI